MLIYSKKPFANRNRRQMAGFWDDMMDTPTVYLDPSVYVDDFNSGEIYDTNDAWAAGTAVMPVDTTILDRWDAVVSNPDATTLDDVIRTTSGDGSDWSWNDVLSTGTTLAREYLRYQQTQLPGGGRIYTTRDPRTGQLITGGRTVMLPTGGAMDFIQRNLPFIAVGGVGLLALAMAQRSK